MLSPMGHNHPKISNGNGFVCIEFHRNSCLNRCEYCPGKPNLFIVYLFMLFVLLLLFWVDDVTHRQNLIRTSEGVLVYCVTWTHSQRNAHLNKSTYGFFFFFFLEVGGTFQEIPTFFFFFFSKPELTNIPTSWKKNLVVGDIYLRFIEIQVLNPCWSDVLGKNEEKCQPSRITFLFYILSWCNWRAYVGYKETFRLSSHKELPEEAEKDPRSCLSRVETCILWFCALHHYFS